MGKCHYVNVLYIYDFYINMVCNFNIIIEREKHDNTERKKGTNGKILQQHVSKCGNI